MSGGLDSATVLAMATAQGYECFTLSMDYGQRHRIELDRAKKVSVSLGAQEHRVVRIDMGSFGGSALTDREIDVPTEETSDIPITYVPARNTVFLSVALGWAEVLEAKAIFIGANAVDYSGYPDCRPEFIKAFEDMANLATKQSVEGEKIERQGIKVEAPIIHLSKGEIILQGIKLGVDYSQTISCYNPRTDGKICQQCDSCRIREAGFQAAGIPDPANS